MAVIVKQPNNLEINNAADCMTYLASVFNSNLAPFPSQTKVKLTSRTGVPSDVAAYSVGLLSFGREVLSIVSLLVLMEDGNFTVMSVPKSNITRWS